MTHILHLGHQPTDIPASAPRLSTVAAGFDPALDVNGLRFNGAWSLSAPFGFPIPEPASNEIWVGVRYVPPDVDARIDGNVSRFLEFWDLSASILLAEIWPSGATNRYHARAHGDTTVLGGSSFQPVAGQPCWLDTRLVVGSAITIELYVDGVLHSSAIAPNDAGKPKPRRVIFGNTRLHWSSTRTWYYAHIAVLDGVSTIGRRFARRVPDTIGTFNQMTGSLDALKDGDSVTRMTSSTAGQRLSFSLTGPTGPAAVTAIAGVHLKQIAQAGSDGPQATAGFLRMGGVNHDAAAVPVPVLAPAVVFSSWAANPVDGSPWTDLTLPGEVGILSA